MSSFYKGHGSSDNDGHSRASSLHVQPTFGSLGVKLSITETREKRNASLSIYISLEAAEALAVHLAEYIKLVQEQKRIEDARHAA